MIRIARAHLLLMVLLGFIAGVSFGVLIATNQGQVSETADWTIAPCTWTSLPPFTVPGWCIDKNNQLINTTK